MTRRLLLTFACALLVVVAISARQAPPAKPDGPLHGAYDLVENWMELPEPDVLIHGTSVFAQTPDRIFIAMAGVTPKAVAPPGLGAFDYRVSKVRHQIFVVNRNGRITERWTQWENRIGSIHELAISPYDPEKHVWVLDRGSQQVLKFTNDGKRIVMELGTRGVPGKDDKHFAQPSDIAWLPDGTFFVADGDAMVTSAQGRGVKLVNTRVVKFDRNGKYLTAWDTGTPGQALHGLAVDAERRVYVGERGAKGSRVTIWDENGKRLDTWELSSFSRVFPTEDGFIWMAMDDGIAKYDKNGKRLYYFKTLGNPPDAHSPHDFTVDSEGNLIFQPASSHFIHKYVPKRNADRSQLVGRRLGESQAAGTR